MNNFKSIRERLGMTQAAIGIELGVTQGNVSFYEKGQTVPPDVARKLIACARSRGHAISYDDIYAPPARAVRRRGSGVAASKANS